MSILFAVSAAAQSPGCWHLMSDSARPLYQRSAFMHGYMHGYEEGFHAADMDLHMGRGAREVKRLKEYRDWRAGYRGQFGDKTRYQHGYQQGFENGYADSISGGEFRAVEEARAAAAGLQDAPVDKHRLKNFDQGLTAGYGAGWQAGRAQPRPIGGDFDSPAPDCRRPGGNQAHNDDYCDGFARGFRMGLLGGFDSQQTQQATSARSSRP